MSTPSPREPRAFIQGLMVVGLAAAGVIISAAMLGGIPQ